jgi:hypothetical protein
MFEMDLGRYTLKVTESAIEYAGSKIDPRAATAVRWVRTNTYVNGALVHQVRLIIVRDSNHRLVVDCGAVSLK